MLLHVVEVRVPHVLLVWLMLFPLIVSVLRSKLELPKKPDQLAGRLWNQMRDRGLQFDIGAKEVDCLLAISKEVG